MANSFLDKTGLSYFWGKIKAYVDSKKPKAHSVVLSSSGWSSNTQTVSVPGILADETKQLIQPIAASSSKEAYEEAGVSCTAQAANSLTFTCSEVPATNLTVYIVITEVVAT